jgi:hypothetical protein
MFSWIRPLFVASLNRGALSAPTQVHSLDEKEIVLGKREKIRIDTHAHSTLETLKLSCRLVKLPLVENNVMAQIYLEGEAFESVGLYSSDVISAHQSTIPEDHLLKGVNFVWLGFMHEDQKYRLETQDGKPLDPQGVFYTHEFRQQTEGHFTVMYRRLADGSLHVMPPGRSKGYPVWRYGGVMGVGGRIHLSEPLFFSLVRAKNKTFVDWVRSKILRELGATYERAAIYNNREIAIQEPEATTETLAEAVTSGCIQIIVKQDNAPPIHMQSIQVKPETESLFTVTFKRK